MAAKYENLVQASKEKLSTKTLQFHIRKVEEI